MAREMTDDEVRAAFVRHVWVMVEYWLREDREPDVRGKLAGLAFSILAAIDGSAAIPGFALAPTPHADDAAFAASEGADWFPSAGDVPHDIAGGLHEIFHAADPRRQ